jgi:hypothetical protein
MSASVSESASESATKLFIGYAHHSVTKEKVKDAFENALNEEGIVSQVDSREKTNDRGEMFWCYFIHFQRKNAQLEHMLKEIAKNGFVVLTYAREWDKKKWNNETHKYGAYVERYWKVLAYAEKPKTTTTTAFVPRLMSLTEAQAAGISAPKKKIAAPEPVAAPALKLCQASLDAWRDENCGGKPALTTDQLYAPNLAWDSDDKLPEIPLAPPVLRRNDPDDEVPPPRPLLRRESRPKRPRNMDVVENAFAALSVEEDPDTKYVADELTEIGFGFRAI